MRTPPDECQKDRACGDRGKRWSAASPHSTHETSETVLVAIEVAIDVVVLDVVLELAVRLLEIALQAVSLSLELGAAIARERAETFFHRTFGLIELAFHFMFFSGCHGFLRLWSFDRRTPSQ